MSRHTTDYDPMKVLGYGPGSEVIYTGKNGYDHDKIHADKYLFAGNRYRVAWVDVGDWHSDVWLEGFADNIYFNSVHFELPGESQLASHLSIAEIAAQRGVEPREVFIEEIEKYGFVCEASGVWWKKESGASEVHDNHAAVRFGTANRFHLPYTAITPALIKAVCGGGE